MTASVFGGLGANTDRKGDGFADQAAGLLLSVAAVGVVRLGDGKDNVIDCELPGVRV